MKAWLGEGGARIAETVSRPALVIPLWKDKSGVEPMDDRNPWREAWQSLNTAGSAVPVTVVRGDALDQKAISAEQAYVGDVSALSRLNERYHAPTIVVAVVEGDKDAGPLSVGGLRYDSQTGARSELRQDAGARMPPSSPTRRRRCMPGSTSSGADIAVVHRDSQDALDVFVPIRSLADWVQVRQRLGAVPAVKSVAVRSLEADRAELRLQYFGTPKSCSTPWRWPA